MTHAESGAVARLRRAPLWVALALLCAPLAGCGLLSSQPPATVAAGLPPPPIALQSVQGLAAVDSDRLKLRLSQSAWQRNLGVVDGATPGAYELSANFHGADTGLDYEWQLRDDQGALLATIPGSDSAPDSPQSDDRMTRIADTASKAVAYKLAGLGFATKVPSLVVPPDDYFNRADKSARFDIDQETLNGPEIAQAPDPTEADLAASLQGAPAVSPEDLAKPGEAAKFDTETQTADGRTVIRAVAVVPVKGAPGSGNAELTAAMRDTLRKAGWAVLDKPRADALTVAGEVGVARADNGNQRVAVRWVVATPEGKSLGDVKQANAVPAGSLDSGWGEAALQVAEAAASGIFDLVAKFR